MVESIEHYLPADHPESTWDQVVACIPKEPSDYNEQIELLKKWFGETKIYRILDVGAGDGSFTKTVIDLLRENSLLAENHQIWIIEKEENLWNKCRNAIPKCRRLTENNGRHALPEFSKSLLEEFDRLAASEEKFDLIIASHITYYFDNAGATLVYALASRLLSVNGAVWSITRDRSCKIYQEREKILLQNELVDVNRNSFSDSLIDRLNSIYELDPDAKSPQMKVSKRTSSLQIPDDDSIKKIVFQYLLWLNNLKVDDLRSFGPDYDDIFSEAHIFTPYFSAKDFSEDSGGDEHRKLRQISVAADCVDLVRRLAPDVVVHRISMASVKPDTVPSGEIDGRRRPNEPALLPEGFKLRAVGFGCYPDENKADHTLSTFFQSNTSFLFYPAFYQDFRHQCPVSSKIHDLADIKHLGYSKVVDQLSYSIRRIRGNPLNPEHRNKKPIQESINDWFKLIKKVYTADENSNDAYQYLWSLCVGATVASDIFRHFPDHQLNSTCGLFLTFSTKHEINQYTSEIIAQIRVRLTQWLGQNFYSEAKSQLSDLQKQAEMLSVLQRPLTRLSDALSAMQSDTQELRAILFEPDESLFASHAEIAPFFVEGEFHGFKEVGIPAIAIHHSQDQYLKDDPAHMQFVLAGVMCAIFGKLGELGRTKGRNQLIAEAMDIVGAAKLGASTRLMAEALEWLLLEDNKRLKETGNTTLPAILHAAVGCDKSRHGVVKALNNIKYALFSPFKPDTHKWHPLALKLLVKHGALKGANLQFIKQVTINDSPVSYASILAFLRDLTIALKSDSRQLTDIKLESSETVTLTCIWNTDIVGTDSSMVDCKFIRKTLSRIIRFPREWRVESANYGDIIRPFIMLANKMLGLNEDKGWQAYTMAEHDVVALQKPNEENIEQMRNFSISCEKNKVIINWTIL